MEKNIYEIIRNNRKIFFILIIYIVLVAIGLILNPPFGLLVLFTLLKIDFMLPFFSKFHFLLAGIFIVLMITLQKYSKENKLLDWLFNILFVMYLIISLIFLIFLVIFGSGGGFFE